MEVELWWITHCCSGVGSKTFWHKCLVCSGSDVVFDAEADKEAATGRPSQPSDGQTVLRPDIDTDEPHLSPSSHTMPPSESPHWTLTYAGDHILDMQSSSKPTADPHPAQSTLDNVEQQFVPLIDADDDLDVVSSSHVEDILNKKNADLKQSSANSGNSHHLFGDDNGVKSDDVAGGESIKQNEEMEFDEDEDKEDDDDDEGGDDDDEEEEGDDGDGEDDATGNSDNINVSPSNVVISITTEEHLEDVKGRNAKSESSSGHGSSQPNHPTASISELSASAVDTKASAESGFSSPPKPVTQQPVVSSGHTEFEQDGSSHSDANVKELHGSGMGQHSHSGHGGKDFSQQQADDIGHRGNWHQDNQPGDKRFRGEFGQHLNHGAHPSMVWNHVHSSPVEEFRNKWPEMQDAYRSWPELMQQEQQYRMDHMTDDCKFMERDQKHFVSHQFDNRWSHISPEDGRYLQNQRARSNQLSSQIPNLDVSRRPNEDARQDANYGDMFNYQAHRDHSYHYQEPAFHRPDIHVEQVYRHHPLGQRYMNNFDGKDPYSGSVDKPARSSYEAAWQPELSTEVEKPRSAAGKLQFDELHVDQGIERPSSTNSAERDMPLTEELTRPVRESNPQYYRDTDISPSSQKYGDDASQPPSPILGRRPDHISGE